MNIKELKLENKNKEVKSIAFGGKTIDVKQYLPIYIKYQIALAVSNVSLEEGQMILNSIKRDIMLTIAILREYCDIKIEIPEKFEDIYDIYDEIKQSGLIDAVLAEIPDNEWEELNNYVNKYVDETKKYRSNLTPYAVAFMNLIDALVPAFTEQQELAKDLEQAKNDIAEQNTDNNNNDNETEQKIEEFEVIE